MAHSSTQETPDTMMAARRPSASIIKKFNPSEIEEREYSDVERAELAKLYDNTFGKIQAGEIISGRIVTPCPAPTDWSWALMFSNDFHKAHFIKQEDRRIIPVR